MAGEKQVYSATLRAARGIREHEDDLARAMVDRQCAAQPVIWNRFGQDGREKGVRDAKYTLNFLQQALQVGEPCLFEDFALWLRQLFESIKLPPESVIEMLDCLQHVLMEALDRDAGAAAAAYIQRCRTALSEKATHSLPALNQGQPHAELAQNYLTALLAGDRKRALKRIMDAVEQGVPVKEIYQYVFEPTQKEVGRLWMTHQISVAQEHFCTAATQTIMAQLYPRIFGVPRNGLRFLGTCAGDELHEMGIRMVADYFEMHGWDTHFLGANTPRSAVLDAVLKQRPHVLGISTTMTYHLPLLEKMISKLREVPHEIRPRIMVGGYPFVKSPNLARKVGADGSTSNGLAAVELANTWMAEAGIR